MPITLKLPIVTTGTVNNEDNIQATFLDKIASSRKSDNPEVKIFSSVTCWCVQLLLFLVSYLTTKVARAVS